MDKFEKIKSDLKNILSEKRYNHSIGVAKMSEELAKIYGINLDIAKITGLAHDIAKEIPNEQKLKYAKENNIKIDEIEAKNIGLLHGKIGADIVKKKYNFTKEMQDAIKYHTTAHINMDMLAKIVFVADKIEENRTYEGVEELRIMAKQNIDNCMIMILDYAIKKNINKKVLIHPDSIMMRNKLLRG